MTHQKKNHQILRPVSLYSLLKSHVTLSFNDNDAIVDYLTTPCACVTICTLYLVNRYLKPELFLPRDAL